jgi:steroid delta-isomerase-like uncharacterized protein
MATKETSVQSIDAAFAQEFGERWLEAWNSHQVERVLGMTCDDIVYDDSAWPQTMRGHGDVREFIEHTWRAFPDMRFELLAGPYVHPSEPRAAFWWRGIATHTGRIDPPGLDPTGRRWEIDGVDFHEYRDGKISRLRIIFDLADAMRQLGTLPDPGSSSERMMMRMANLKTRLRRRQGS